MHDKQYRTGKSRWIARTPIPPPHPEMEPIPIGTTLIGQTHINGSIIILEREKRRNDSFETNMTYIHKDDATKYLETYSYGPNWPPKEASHDR